MLKFFLYIYFFAEDNSEYASGVRQSARIAFDEEVQKPKRTVSHQLEPVKLEGAFCETFQIGKSI